MNVLFGDGGYLLSYMNIVRKYVSNVGLIYICWLCYIVILLLFELRSTRELQGIIDNHRWTFYTTKVRGGE